MSDSAAGPEAERLRLVVEGLTDALHRAVDELQITEDELWSGIDYLNQVGAAGEFALLSDVLGISVLIDRITHGVDASETPSNVLGPYYVPGAPVLPPPFQLAPPGEPGEPLLVSGRVSDASSGAPLPGALLDVWQANAEGVYSNQDPTLDPFHLRGKVPVNDEGRYSFHTVTPPPYEIPKHGPVGRLLRAVGRHAFRPAHLHLKVTCDGYASLTTMVFMAGDEYLETDTIGAVKDRLVVPLDHAQRAEGDASAGSPPASCTFDIVLRPA